MLADYQVERREFDLKGGSFSVSGLSLTEIEVLLRTHLPDLETLFDLFAHIENVSNEDMHKIILAVVNQAPGFAANVIAMAAGEPQCAPIAQRLAGPLQVEILKAIGELTFSEVGGVKKFLETVAAMFGLSNLQEKVKTAAAKVKKAK